ncbi:MAG: GNAT family N-acetyltransferase [Alphaproteobacteria bacterium]|nr:GNAT family N-acetyltransferase [Alphaproteobacteria bacterium]
MEIAFEPPGDWLASAWRDLEARARPSFFLSWDWMGCWLAEARPDALAVVARHGGRIVGLALVGRAGRHLLLGETGDRTRDMLTIEFNGFLAEPAHAEAVARDGLRRLIAERRPLHLSGIGEDLAALAGGLCPRVRLRARKGCPFIDVSADHLERLGRNTRQQVRRSMRLFEDENGPLALEPAETVAQGLDWLDGMASLHQARWRARGQPGAFAQPFFGRFHRRLIAAALPHGKIDLLRLRAGSRTLGYLYNLRQGGEVYAYQNGFDYSADARLKPGLVAHCLAVRRYAAMGLWRYHLMAGESRYKANLATGFSSLAWLTLLDGGLMSRVEHWLRAARDGLRR